MQTNKYTINDIIEVLKKYGDGDYFFYKSFFRSLESDRIKYKREYLNRLKLVFDRLNLDKKAIDISKYEQILVSKVESGTWHTTDGDHIPRLYGKMYCTYKSIKNILIQELNIHTTFTDNPITQLKNNQKENIIITANEAKELALGKHRLQEIEKLIKKEAKEGKAGCVYAPHTYNFNFRDLEPMLEGLGFNVRVDTYYRDNKPCAKLIIRWL